MDRRKFIKATAAACSGYSFLNLISSCKEALPQKPNIVFILADDLGYGDLSCYGQRYFKTPNIDRLAETGMRFTQHYAGSPVSAPSRCVLLTGKHTGNAYVRGNKQAEPSGQLALPHAEITFSHLLKGYGYKTGCFGKWGLGIAGTEGDPLSHGFDQFFGYYDQVRAHNSYPEFLYHNGEKVNLDNEVVYMDESHWSGGLGSYSTEKNEYSNDLILEKALSFMEENKESPFLLYFPTTIPHDNGEAPKGKRFEVPDMSQFDEKDWSDEEKAYAALVVKLDEYVGKIESKLKELGIDRNTIIIFTSDNGAVNPSTFENRFQSNGLFRGYKRDLYEGGIRVPLIIKWPEVIGKGRISNHISAFWDFLPTFCEIAGIKLYSEQDGISFLPALRGEKQPKHDYLYWEFHWWNPSSRAVRTGKWKAVQNSIMEPIELFNLEEDPEESRDISADHPDVISNIETIFATAREPSTQFRFKT